MSATCGIFWDENLRSQDERAQRRGPLFLHQWQQPDWSLSASMPPIRSVEPPNACLPVRSVLQVHLHSLSSGADGGCARLWHRRQGHLYLHVGTCAQGTVGGRVQARWEMVSLACHILMQYFDYPSFPSGLCLSPLAVFVSNAHGLRHLRMDILCSSPAAGREHGGRGRRKRYRREAMLLWGTGPSITVKLVL